MSDTDRKRPPSGIAMKNGARSIAGLFALPLLCLAGCGVLPVGIAPTANVDEEACRPDLEIEFENGLAVSNYPLGPSEENRVKQCERFYREAEQERKEELSQALRQQMNPTLAESPAESPIRLSTEPGAR